MVQSAADNKIEINAILMGQGGLEAGGNPRLPDADAAGVVDLDRRHRRPL